jgi:hypothetical protein
MSSPDNSRDITSPNEPPSPRRRPTQGSSSGSERLKIIEAIRAPIAFFTLALMVIEAILAVLASSGRRDPQTTLILVSGMVASLLLLLVSFIVILFTKPDILFRSGPLDEAITAFGRIGEQLTGHDVGILHNMLGTGAQPFQLFCNHVVEDNESKLKARENKFKKLGFLQTVGGSEVQLTDSGAKFINTIARYSLTAALATSRMRKN